LNRQEDIPRDLQFAAYESSIERDKSILTQNRELSNLLHQIRGNYIKEVSFTGVGITTTAAPSCTQVAFSPG
jgi:hypothetical protein